METNSIIAEGKECKKCGEFKSLSCYHYSRSTKDNKRGECIGCYKRYQEEYLKSWNGTFKKLLNSAKCCAKIRNERGRLDAGVCEINQQDIEEQYNKQNGFCFYSGIKMNFDKNDWKISIERLDTNKGYIKDNIVLICLEFNSKMQWSAVRIREMIDIIDHNDNQTYEDIDFHSIPKPRKMKKIIKYDIDNICHYNCTSCDRILPILHFRENNVRDGCKECRDKKNKQYRGTPRGTLLHIVNHCKSNLQKKKQERNLEYDIDFEYLVDLFKKQNGLCTYSRMPLEFGDSYLNKFWKISIERLDVTKGYVKGNVCFICLPFNGTDNTVMMKDKSNGNAGWNKEKFQYFLNIVKAKYAIDS